MLFQFVAFAIIPMFVENNTSWENIKIDVYVTLSISFVCYWFGHILRCSNLKIRVFRIKPLICSAKLNNILFLKMSFFVTVIFIGLQIVFRVMTNSLVLGDAGSVQSNILTTILAYILMFFGMSHTGALFFSFLSILSMLILRISGEYKWVVFTLVLYFILSIITTQKSLLILPVLVMIVSYHYLIKKISTKRIIAFVLLLPALLLWAVISNYLRWAQMNNVTTTLYDAFNTINFSDALDYFVMRFDFFLSATYALNDKALYPGSYLDLLKSFLFFIPYNRLFGDGIFPVKFAQAYQVPGYEIGVGVTVPLVVDLFITYGHIAMILPCIFIGYFFSSLHQNLYGCKEIKSSTLFYLVLIPMAYISSATIPLFEFNYNLLRNILFTANYLFLLRIVYDFFRMLVIKRKNN